MKPAYETKSAITFKALAGTNERLVTEPVSASRYVELYKAGKLYWQIKKEPPPDYYPLLEEAEEEAEFERKKK
jgi:hypothetical protein